VRGEELEHWLERELEELRRDISQGTIRLSRLINPLPTTDIGIGWMIEFDLPEHRFQFDWGRIATTLRDLRLLGFQPTLLAPPGMVVHHPRAGAVQSDHLMLEASRDAEG
jgi:hypothetical protein